MSEEKHTIEKPGPLSAEEQQKMHEAAVKKSVAVLQAGNRGAGQPIRNPEAQQALIQEKELELIEAELRTQNKIVVSLAESAKAFRLAAILFVVVSLTQVGLFVAEVLK